jgi:hypothetical protein
MMRAHPGPGRPVRAAPKACPNVPSGWSWQQAPRSKNCGPIQPAAASSTRRDQPGYFARNGK